MDLGRLFRRGSQDPAPADTGDRVHAAFHRLVALIPGDMLLNPPATEADIAVAEAHLGQRFPADVRALYLLHDGQHQYTLADPRWAFGLFAESAFLSLTEVLTNWDTWDGFDEQTDMDEFATSTPANFVQEKYSTRGWIPLTHDGSGNHIGIDLAPGRAGRSGQVITFGADDDEHQVLAPSLLSYLEQLGDLLDAGYATVSDDVENEPGWYLRGSNGAIDARLFHATGTAPA